MYPSPPFTRPQIVPMYSFGYRRSALRRNEDSSSWDTLTFMFSLVESLLHGSAASGGLSCVDSLMTLCTRVPEAKRLLAVLSIHFHSLSQWMLPIVRAVCTFPGK